jgi:natural product precursor
MKKLSEIKAMNENNLEKDQMNKMVGGDNTSCTLPTVVITPNGPGEDEDDTYAGECGGFTMAAAMIKR